MKTFPLGAVALLIGSAVSAQQVVATSPLNIRSGQSASSKVRGHLGQGDTAILESPNPRSGYYHVRSADGVVGWAWAARLQPITGVVAEGTPGATNTSNAAATTISASWNKTPNNAEPIHWADGNHAACAADGVGGDEATNLWKNRTDSATSYHAVSWDALAGLEFPHNQKKRRGGNKPWTAGELAAIAKYEGTPISVEAYLSGVKEEIPGKDPRTHEVRKGESTNCGENTSPRVDWHMYLTKQPNQSHKLAIVVETTPRVRPSHPGWTLARLQQISSDGTPVRISGWLMMDPEHWDQMWQYKSQADTVGTKARITLWEIHPITRIEVKQNGVWRSIDMP